MARVRQPQIRSKMGGSKNQTNNNDENSPLRYHSNGIVNVSYNFPAEIIKIERECKKRRSLTTQNVPSPTKNNRIQSNKKISMQHKKHPISSSILPDMSTCSTLQRKISSLKKRLELQKVLTEKKIIQSESQ